MHSAHMLGSLADELTAAGIRVQAVEARSSVRERLRSEGVDDKLGRSTASPPLPTRWRRFQNQDSARPMLEKVPMVLVLVAGTVLVRAVGLAVLPSVPLRSRSHSPTPFWPVSWLLICVAWALIFIHVIEISIRALFHTWQECRPDVNSALHFSGITCTTASYGDVLLSGPSRLFAPVEGLTGVLRCGLSTGPFFAAVNGVVSHALEVRTT